MSSCSAGVVCRWKANQVGGEAHAPEWMKRFLPFSYAAVSVRANLNSLHLYGRCHCRAHPFPYCDVVFGDVLH